MLKEFKKYDKEAIKYTDVPISELNRWLEKVNFKVRVLMPWEENAERCILSVENMSYIPFCNVVSDLLEIHCLDIRYTTEWSGCVRITYEK